MTQQITQQILDLAVLWERLSFSTEAVFDAAPSNACETPMQQCTTLSTREKMLELHRQGVALPKIERRFVEPPMTVYGLGLIELLHDRETLSDHK